MASVDRDNDRTFKANFTDDGVAILKQRVYEKLKEFMGDYSDDNLVEYVIVLWRNGRGKEQAKNVLNVFLGENCDSFVSWLWEHLALNIDLYVQPKQLQDEAPKRKVISEVQAGGDGFQHLNSQSERGKVSKLSRRRRNKDWKGLVGREAEAPPQHSFDIDKTHLEERPRSKVDRGRRSPSPPPSLQTKRTRVDEHQKTKRDLVSQVTIDVPRRLLQFAVRDAVTTSTSRPSNTGTTVEPSLKRLCSVVSPSTGESSLVELPQGMQTISRMANPMATVIKAVAEAAEDVIKFKSSGSVFDRLGCAMNPSDGNNQLEDNYQHHEQSELLNFQRTDYVGPYAAKMTKLEHETGFPSDEGFDDVNVMGCRVTGASQFGSSGGNWGDDSLMAHYSVAKNADDCRHLNPNRDQEQPAAALTTKVVNISAKANTKKPPGRPPYHNTREVAELDAHETIDSEMGAPRSGLRQVKENAEAVKITNGNENPTLDLQKELQKVELSTCDSSAAVHPIEDADSRTIFASNVHFAATKDGLSRHFSKFGEVLKVVIVTDVTTGQPKGAAYVVFMRKEAADNALSLDGTSFMSRILKVVRKGAAHQESAPAVPWPHIVRGSPFPSVRFSRVPFPRFITGAFRSRPPIKFGARSLQWKRDAQGTSSDNGQSLNNSSISAPATRGLTYVRTESKIEGTLSNT